LNQLHGETLAVRAHVLSAIAVRLNLPKLPGLCRQSKQQNNRDY
jgi:hypothetical protein